MNRDALLSLSRMEDPLGVLSIYVDADSAAETGRRAAWEIGVRNGLRELERQVNEDGPQNRSLAVSGRLTELRDEIEQLLDRAASGRGRALFAALESGEVRRVALRMPLPTRVVLEERAYVGPLVQALEQGRPAGVVLVSGSRVLILEQALGEIVEIQALDFAAATAGWREMKGPAAGNPASSQQTAPQRDRFQRRLEEHQRSFLASAAARVARLAGARGWDQVLACGEARILRILVTALPAGDYDVLEDARSLEQMPLTELSDVVASTLTDVQRRRNRVLVERAASDALAGASAALGLGETLAALAEARVAHLLLDGDRAFRGTRLADGRLLPEGETVAAGKGDLAVETNLAERMIERALDTGARVTLVDGEAAEKLGASGGIAALLRW